MEQREKSLENPQTLQQDFILFFEQYLNDKLTDDSDYRYIAIYLDHSDTNNLRVYDKSKTKQYALTEKDKVIVSLNAFNSKNIPIGIDGADIKTATANIIFGIRNDITDKVLIDIDQALNELTGSQEIIGGFKSELATTPVNQLTGVQELNGSDYVFLSCSIYLTSTINIPLSKDTKITLDGRGIIPTTTNTTNANILKELSFINAPNAKTVSSGSQWSEQITFIPKTDDYDYWNGLINDSLSGKYDYKKTIGNIEYDKKVNIESINILNTKGTYPIIALQLKEALE